MRVMRSGTKPRPRSTCLRSLHAACITSQCQARQSMVFSFACFCRAFLFLSRSPYLPDLMYLCENRTVTVPYKHLDDVHSSRLLPATAAALLDGLRLPVTDTATVAKAIKPWFDSAKTLCSKPLKPLQQWVDKAFVRVILMTSTKCFFSLHRHSCTFALAIQTPERACCC